MKIALAFWGITRSLKFTIDSIKEKIFKALRKNNIEFNVFIHTYKLNNYVNMRTGEKNKNVNNDEYKLLTPHFIKIDEQSEISKKLNLTRYRRHPDPWGTNYNSVDNFILAMYSKSKVTRMIKRSKIDFDYIVFLRPDVRYLDDLKNDFFNKVNNNTICIPNFHLYPLYKFNDRFCICNKNTYIQYGDIFDKLLSLSERQSLHSETIIGQLMNECKINVIRIDFRFLRVRCDGKAEKIDFRIH